MKTPGFALAALILSGVSAGAASLSESFDQRSDFASGTAVWNQALGKIHPTLRVMNYDQNVTPPPIDFSVGDGSDGVFDHTTYANFSAAGDVSGNIIRLDTAAHPILQVTSFTLDAGWKLIPSGANPLIIKSLSTVKILGEIHCEGNDGLPSSGVTAGLGGTGRCGGMDGGNGGSAPSGTGLPGVSTIGSVTGGGGGQFVFPDSGGGGGGGSWSTVFGPPSIGPNSGGGTAGTSFSDPEFTTLLGGAGGGGGSGDATVTPPVGAAGGGGGAGGGLVLIFAVGNVDVGESPSSTTGFIYASGGKGGDGSDTAGPGGGGGGGSVQIFSGGKVNLFNVDANGAVQSLAGSSGTNGNIVLGALGGAGRNWVSDATLFTGGVVRYNPTQEFPGTSGNIEFNSATQSVVTRAFDTANIFPIIESLNVSPASQDFLFEVSGSDDGFVLDDTGWTTSPAVVEKKRYLKMRLSITTSHVAAPTMIDTASVEFGSLDNFKFKSAGCGRVGGGSQADVLWLLIAPLLLLGLKIHAKGQLARERARARR